MMRARLEQIGVAAVALLTYANTLANRFAVDDDFIIAGNARVHQLADQAAIWLTPYWPAYGEQLGLYRPLAIFAYALQWAAGDGAPWLFHLTSVLLHALVTLLVLALLRRLIVPGAALAGALLFAVHPVHTEVVANVVGQAELLAAAAVLGGCVLYVSRPAGTALDPRRAMAMAVLFGLALLAKEGAIVMPALLVVLDLAQGRASPQQGGARSWARGLVPVGSVLVGVMAGWLALRYRVLGTLTGSDAAPWLPFLREDGRVLAALRVWPEYARLLFFPADLSADYSPAVIVPAAGVSPMVLLGVLLLAGTAALALLTPWRRAAGLPAAWFLIAVLPVSNLLFPIGVPMAERLLYLPSVGLAIAAGFLWVHIASVSMPRARQGAAAVAAVILVVLGGRAIVRNPDWRDSAAYYEALLRDHPESYRAQWGEAARRLSHGDRAGALQAMEIAHRIWPYDAQLLSELALLHIWDHAYGRAVPLLERSTQLNDRARQAWVNLAYVYIGVRRPADAELASVRAEALGADVAETRSLRAQSFELREQWPDAIRAWRETVSADRGRTWTYWSAFARALARAGRIEDALAAADTARVLAPAGSVARVTAVRSAVKDGCYHETAVRAGAGSCQDPLADWAIVTAVNGLPADTGSRKGAD